MTYNCEYSTASIDERLTRFKRLDKTTCGLASTVDVSTPTMESVADWGVEPRGLGHGFLTNQQLVMPFYQAYREVSNSIHSRLGSGPVETLRYGLPKDSSDWSEVIFVSEKQVIEELATSTLTERGLGTKGKFISACNHVRSHVKGFAERLNNLWKNIADPVSQCFIPRKPPIIFRWPSNNAWNPND